MHKICRNTGKYAKLQRIIHNLSYTFHITPGGRHRKLTWKVINKEGVIGSKQGRS